MMQNANENTQYQSRVTKVALVVTLLAVVGVVALVQSSWTPAAGHVSNKVHAELAKKRTDVAMDKSCICPYIYAPVCGADGLTYPNDCVARCQPMPVVCNKPCPCTKQEVVDDADGDKQAAALKEKQMTEEKMDVKKDVTCPPNMVFSQCNAYPACQRTCQYKNGRPCPRICFPGCVCKPGFVLISDQTLICIQSTAC